MAAIDQINSTVGTFYHNVVARARRETICLTKDLKKLEISNGTVSCRPVYCYGRRYGLRDVEEIKRVDVFERLEQSVQFLLKHSRCRPAERGILGIVEICLHSAYKIL